MLQLFSHFLVTVGNEAVIAVKAILKTKFCHYLYMYMYSLGHGSFSQTLLSLAKPAHGAPPLAGLGLTQ